MTSRLEGKAALVTGGSNGIGRAIALAFAREGADVVVTYLSDATAGEQVAREIGACGVRAGVVRADLSAPDRYREVLQDAEALLGNISILVNNAAVLTRTPFLEIRPDEFDHVLTTDLRSPFFLTQAVAHHMIDRGIAGSVINVSSLSAERAVSRVAHYQTAKAGLNMLTKSAAYELAPYGIRVNALAPGLTATKGNQDQRAGDGKAWHRRSQGIPLGRAGLPEDHVGAAVFLASDESSWMTGSVVLLDGGFGTA